MAKVTKKNNAGKQVKAKKKAKKKSAKPKGKARKKPSPRVLARQRIVVNKISANVGRGMSRKQAMIEAGYSESYADTSAITRTEAWQKLMEENLPDSELARHHKQLLNARALGEFSFSLQIPDDKIIEVVEKAGCELIQIEEVHTKDPKFTRKVAYYSIPDSTAKKHALDMAYKLKQKYGDLTIKHKFGELTDEELEAEIAERLSRGLGDGAGIEEEKTE